DGDAFRHSRRTDGRPRGSAFLSLDDPHRARRATLAARRRLEGCVARDRPWRGDGPHLPADCLQVGLSDPVDRYRSAAGVRALRSDARYRLPDREVVDGDETSTRVMGCRPPAAEW